MPGIIASGAVQADMPYQGDYQGQYAGIPTYHTPQQPPPQYHANGMQYPGQQQAMHSMAQPVYHVPMNADMYSKQYYQPQQHRPQAAAQPVQYSPQYSGFPQSQQQRPQYVASMPQSSYRQIQQQPSSYPAPLPVLQQRQQSQQYAQPPQHLQFQQGQPTPAVASPPWPNQSIPMSRPPQAPVQNAGWQSSGQVQRSPALQTPNQTQVALPSVVPDQHLPSSPDPLAPSPASRQARPPPQPQRVLSRQQSRPSAPLAASRPNVDLTPNPRTSQHRIASHVEIPVMSQPTKRRRSNEGQPVPVCQGPDVDYQAALLGLSDEYIVAAYSMQDLETDEHLEEYHDLITAGMGCLESVLKNYRHTDARKEARIRLRLATLLVEETENDEEAEETLSKGIALCDRSRLTDLKYAMHHLSARLTFKRSPRAALKAVENLIRDVEALRLLHWMYSFRLLRVCLGLQMPGQSETNAMLKHLTAMAATADEHRHISVRITVATIEAMVHLRSGATDAVDLAERAIASARTHQLGPEMGRMPQIQALLDCLDLCGSLIIFNPSQALAKMSQMHTNLDPATRQPGWTKTGTVDIVMLPWTNSELDLDTSGIMKTTSDGMAALNVRWMDQAGIYVIAYLLSGIACLHKSEEGRAAGYLREGLQLNSNWIRDAERQRSLNDRVTADDHQMTLDVAAHLLIIFDLCSRFDWKTARDEISQVQAKVAKYDRTFEDNTTRTILYLDAMCKHALGDLDGALQTYRSPSLAFEEDVKFTKVEKDLRILSALNSIVILRTMGAGNMIKAENLHASIESHCLGHQNKSFEAAYFIMKAIGNGSKTTIIDTKKHLSSAVNAARTSANNQLLSIVMNAMTDLFFQGIIGDQAEKSVKAARSLARKGHDNLWWCVADSMFAEINERCGKPGEAAAARKEGANLLKGLPDSLKRKLALEASGGNL